MSRRRQTPEEATDAFLEGDLGFAPGTVRAALSHRAFRIIWTGALASSIGTWMQNVVLTAFAYQLTRDASFTGLVAFAQLGPSMLAFVGGALADTIDRRRLLIAAQVQQMLFSFLLAWIASAPDPSRMGIVGCVLAIGVGQAMNGPAYSSLLPELVGREDLPGAVSLQSFQMNISRVVGPPIGGLLYAATGSPEIVFALNGLTYLAAIAAVAMVDLAPRVVVRTEGVLRRLLGGFRVARHDPLVRRILLTMTLFSFFSLSFIGLLPVLADEHLGIEAKSVSYHLLYTAFGLGAALGAVSIGTLLAGHSKPTIVRRCLALFGVLLAAFGVERMPALAYPTVLLLGFVYFAAVTSLSTVLQQHLEDHVRGRVMALWIMAFGGTVPLGTLAAGPVADAASITVIPLAGAAVALLLAWYADLRGFEPEP